MALHRKLDRGTARFLKFPKGRAGIDPDKVAEAARWDGLSGIVASGLGNLSADAQLTRYRRLREIGTCLRTNKHDLRVRPVFHRAERRVRAHIAICCMAFCCLQHPRHRLAAFGHPMSPEARRRERDQLRISVLERTSETASHHGLPGRASKAAKAIHRCLGLTWNRRVFLVTPRPERQPKTAQTPATLHRLTAPHACRGNPRHAVPLIRIVTSCLSMG